MPVITDAFRIANYCEAALWGAIGLAAVAFALRRAGRARGRCALLAAAMFAFGVSDLVETRTGAWWRPWWLLAWKVACVIALLLLLAEYSWHRRNARQGNVPLTPETAPRAGPTPPP